MEGGQSSWKEPNPIVRYDYSVLCSATRIFARPTANHAPSATYLDWSRLLTSVAEPAFFVCSRSR